MVSDDRGLGRHLGRQSYSKTLPFFFFFPFLVIKPHRILNCLNPAGRVAPNLASYSHFSEVRITFPISNFPIFFFGAKVPSFLYSPSTPRSQLSFVVEISIIAVMPACIVTLHIHGRIEEFEFPIRNFSSFLLGGKAHPPKEKPAPQPPHEVHHPQWPHSGCGKMGSCVLPLVSFLDLCIFALIRKL